MLSALSPTMTFHKGTVQNDLTPKYSASGQLLLPHQDPKDANIVARFRRSYKGKPEVDDHKSIHDPNATRLPRSVWEQPDYGTSMRRDLVTTTRNDRVLEGINIHESKRSSKTGGVHDTGVYPEVRFVEREAGGYTMPKPVALRSGRNTTRTFNAKIEPEETLALDRSLAMRTARTSDPRELDFGSKLNPGESKLPGPTLVTAESTLHTPINLLTDKDATPLGHLPAPQQASQQPERADTLLHAGESAAAPRGMQRAASHTTARTSSAHNLQNDVSSNLDMVVQRMPKKNGSIGQVLLSDVSTMLNEQLQEQKPRRSLTGTVLGERDEQMSMREDTSTAVAGPMRHQGPTRSAPVGEASLHDDDGTRPRPEPHSFRSVGPLQPSVTSSHLQHRAAAPSASRSGVTFAPVAGETSTRDDTQIDTHVHLPTHTGVHMRPYVPAVHADARNSDMTIEPARPRGHAMAADLGHVELHSSAEMPTESVSNLSTFLRKSLLFGSVEGRKTETTSAKPVLVTTQSTLYKPITGEPKKSESFQTSAPIGKNAATRPVSRQRHTTHSKDSTPGRMPGGNASRSFARDSIKI